jgi:hypothetical protein
MAKTKEPMTFPTVHAPGIYFGMSEDEYHADDAIGSTSLRELYIDPPEYWWHSPMNPNRPASTTASHLTFGKAIHKLVLEGRQSFEAAYVRHDDDPEIFETGVEMADYLVANGHKAPQKLADRWAAIKEVYPAARWRQEIVEAAEAAGKEIVKPDDYARMLIASKMITANPKFAPAFEGGAPEVSIFWESTIRGITIRQKARIDYLKIAAEVDLKSIRNPLDIPFKEACRRRFSNHRHDLQAAHYLEARRQIGELFASGAPIVGDVDMEWLEKVADYTGACNFVLIYFQAEGAPLTHSIVVAGNSELRALADDDRLYALDRYASYFETFGKEVWLNLDSQEIAAKEDLPINHGRRPL